MARSHIRTSGSLARPSESVVRLEIPGSAEFAVAPIPRGEHGPDVLSDVLRMVRLTGALFFMVDASDPWGVEVPHADAYAAILLPRAQQIVSYHIVLEGSGFATIAGVASTRFEAGDILVFAHGDPYTMLSAPEQAPEFDSEATLQFFREIAAGRLPFVVEEGGGGLRRTRFVCGYLGCDLHPFNPVISTLPRLLHVNPAGSGSGMLEQLIELTLAEARTTRVGGDCIRLRLSELIFVEVLRHYLATLPVGSTGWLSGLRDPAIGRTLSLLHQSPSYSWTLNELAECTGVSRPVLAERFGRLVGCPPMQYLMLWRMQIAAHLLADGAMKVAAAGRHVGYESEAAFSRAFKRAAGISRAEWRGRYVSAAAERSADPRVGA